MKRTCRCVFGLLSAAVLFSITLTIPNRAEEPQLCVGNYQSEAEAVQQLERFAKTYHTLGEWKERAANIRQCILRGAGLDPMPPKTSLNPIFRKKRTYDGYTVENVAFESAPGIFVTGSLYRPTTGKGWSRKAVSERHDACARPYLLQTIALRGNGCTEVSNRPAIFGQDQHETCPG